MVWEYILIGVVFVMLYKLILVICNLAISRAARPLGLGTKWMSENGEYAMVCGATGAMGVAYTKMFGSMRFNLILVSNNAAKLRDLAEHVEKKYDLKDVITIEADFTNEDSYNKIQSKIDALQHSCVALVNAMSVSQPLKSFDQFNLPNVREMLLVNVFAPVRVIHIVLPHMMDRNRGVIINFSSPIGELYFPRYALYGASKCLSILLSPSLSLSHPIDHLCVAAKAFMRSFSVTLSMECEKYNITVQNVQPLLVRSKLTPEVRSDGCMTCTAGEVGFEAMRVVGVFSTTYGHWKHSLMLWVMKLFSFILGRKCASRLLNVFRFCFVVAIKDPDSSTSKVTSVTSQKSFNDKSVQTISYKSLKEKSESHKQRRLAKPVMTNPSGIVQPQPSKSYELVPPPPKATKETQVTLKVPSKKFGFVLSNELDFKSTKSKDVVTLQSQDTTNSTTESLPGSKSKLEQDLEENTPD